MYGKMKRIVSIMMALVLLATGVDLSFLTVASAEGTAGSMSVSETPDEILSMGEWLYWVEDGQAIVAGYTNLSETSLTVPYHLGGYPVTGIGHRAFSANTSLSRIQMHTNVTSIADDAFAGLSDVTVAAYHGAYALEYAENKKYETKIASNAAQFADDVIDITGVYSKAYNSLCEDSVIFETNEATFLRSGQILYFPATKKYPSGLAKKVHSISIVGDKFHVSLTDTDFGAVFEAVSADSTLYLDWDNAIYPEWVTSVNDVSSESIFLDYYDGSVSNIKYEKEIGAKIKLDKYWSVEGKFKFDVTANASYTIRRILLNFSLDQAEVRTVVETEASLKLKSQAKTKDKYFNPSGKYHKTSAISVPFFSAYGFSGYIVVNFIFEISGSFEVTCTSVTQHIYTYKNHDWNHESTPIAQSESCKLEGKGKVGPEVGIELDVGIAGLMEFTFFDFSLSLYVEGKGAIEEQTITGHSSEFICLDVTVGLYFEVKVKVGIVKVTSKVGDIKYEIGACLVLPQGKKGKITIIEPVTFHWDKSVSPYTEELRRVKTCRLEDRLVVIKCQYDTYSHESMMTVDVNDFIPEPQEPTRKGYKFVGWYAENGWGNDYIFDFSKMRMPYINNGEAFTIYAKWRDLYPITAITLNKTSITGLSNVGTTEKLTTASILPANANNKEVKWSSSNTEVATVDANGNVKLRNAGTAIITCTSVGNPDVKATCTVTVLQSATGIELNKTSIFRYSDDMSAEQLTATVLPTNAADKSVTWTSSNPAVAEVSSTGLVTLKGLGTAEITCRSVSNPNVVATCSVTVRQAVTGIALDQQGHLRTNADMSSLQLNAEVSPASAWNKALTWESSNPAVAKVSASGLVTMVGVGNTVITCRSVSNPDITDTFDLTIIQAVTEIDLNETAFTCYSDHKDSIQLTADVRPVDAGNKAVTWVSSDPSVVTVSDSGAVIVVGAGTAMVICRSVSDPSVTAECKFTVLQAVTGITLNETSINTNSDEINVTHLLAEVAPANAANKTVKWESSDPSVAEVSIDGVVTIKGVGEADITCSSESTPYIMAVCKVTVKQAVTDMQLSESSVYRYSNDRESFQLIATLTADEQADIEVVWKSSNTAAATVSNSGIVTINGVGEAIITCQSVSNPAVTAQCLVIVRQSVESISLNESELVCYSDATDSVQLTATVAPADAANSQVKWTSSNEAVAIASDTGLVTVIGAGRAIITCSSISDPEIYDTCAITVHQAVASLHLNAQEITRYTNETGAIQLSAYVQPSYAYSREVSWQSSNEAVATVNEQGMVEIKGTGEAVITCTSLSNPAATAQCRIIVHQAVTSVTLDKSELVLQNDADAVQLTANVQPASAQSLDVAWSSSDSSVVTVSDSGLVSVVGCGTASVTCRSLSNPDAFAVCHVTVKQAVLSVGLSNEELVCYSDEKEIIQLTASIQPVYADDRGVEWESSDEYVAIVSDEGVLSLVGIGEATITCRSVSNPDVYAQCIVRVMQPMTGVVLDQTAISMYSDDAEDGIQLTHTVSPVGTEDTSVLWESSNTNVAIVSDDGFVQAVGQGTAVITCRSVRNPETIYATCTVAVLQPVEELVLYGDTDSLLPGETLLLSAACYPDYADNTDIVWTTDDASVATVDQQGCVTAVGYGTTAVTAEAKDGRGACATYTVHVEHELVLNAEVATETVYMQGTDPVILGYVSINNASVRRLAEQGIEPVWSMVKPDDNDDVELELVTTTVADRGQSYETTYAVLSGSEFTAAGSRTYMVKCEAGAYSGMENVVIFVDGAEYAEKAMVTPSTITLGIDEAVLLPAAPVGADGCSIPEGVTLYSINGDSFFDAYATVTETDEGKCVAFAQSGIYTAVLQYTAGNIAYEVNVTYYVQDENGIIRIRTENVDLDQSHVVLVQGEDCTLNATVKPLDAYDTAVVWSSTDENVATVDQNGNVKAIAPGKAAIICTANDGSGASAMCSVSVESFLQLDDAELTYTVYTGGEDHAELGIVNVTIESEKRLHEAGLNVTWQLEKLSGTATNVGVEEFQATAEESITVSGNRIMLLRVNAAGTDEYRLTCKASDFIAECSIDVQVVDKRLPNEIHLPQTMYVGQVGEIIAVDTTYIGGELPEGTVLKIRGGNAFENALASEYDFTEPEKLIFQKAGTYAADVIFEGSNYSYSCPITITVHDEMGNVPVNITGISIAPEHLYMQVGDQSDLVATVEPTDASYGVVSWHSSDTAVATVSSNGCVTALGVGSAYITVSVPESDFAGGCLVIVEDGLTLQTEAIDRTVFVDGITRMQLDTVQLTTASSRQLEGIPEWSLSRVSGNNLTLRVQQHNTTTADGEVVYGCAIILYSMSREGTVEYELTCRANGEEVVIPVTVHAVSRDLNLPSGLGFGQTEFSASIGELITIVPDVYCLPTGTVMPDGMRVELDGDTLFVSAQNIADYYVSQNMTTLSFNRAGLFTANFIYSYSNMRYVIPVTFHIEDENGHVPVLSATMTLSSRSLWLVEGEEAMLSAVLTPSDADNRQVTWASTDESVVIVDEHGNVTAVSKGEAYIICTPEDPLLPRQICTVWVEDYLTLETAEEHVSLYKQGEQRNEVFSAVLSEGTMQRLNKAGIKPQWKITRIGGDHSTVITTVSEPGDTLIISSIELVSGGSDTYRVTCTAGTHTSSCDFILEVLDLGDAAQSITLMETQVTAEVGQTLTLDFTPVCQPAGSSIPQNDEMWTLYSGVGEDFYDAMDFSVYAEEGDFVTVRFTKPGRYLLSRQFFLGNLHYSQVCEIIVGESNMPLSLIKADTTEVIVYMGGKAGTLAQITMTDSILHDLYGDSVSWQLKRISGNSLTAVLKDISNGVILYAASADAVGEDVWRVTASFGDLTESIDIHVSVCNPRSAVPETVSLVEDRLSGMMGDWLSMPIAVRCDPVGSALPETGDDFWRFEPSGTVADVSTWSIEDGMLRIRFLQPGYYTGMLCYEAGNFRYDLPVYMSITDEEGVLTTPPMEMYIMNTADKVFINGTTKIAISTVQVSRGSGSYYAGEAAAYMDANEAVWSVRVISGDAAMLSIITNGNNTASVVLDAVQHLGSVTYEVQCSVNGTTYSATNTLEVVSGPEDQPVPTLGSSIFYAKPGEMLIIPTSLYDRESGSILQSATEWNPSAFLSAIGYEYTQTDDNLQVVFYKEGTYATKLMARIGNLVFDVPFTIVISSNPEAEYAVMKLPAMLESIEEQAFMGSLAQIVDLRGTKVTRIGAGAFSNCSNLVIIYIPVTVTSIATDAFSGSPNVTIVCEPGSAADTYAAEQEIAVRYE